MLISELESLPLSDETLSEIRRAIRQQFQTIGGHMRDLNRDHRAGVVADKDYATSRKSLVMATLDLLEILDSLPSQQSSETETTPVCSGSIDMRRKTLACP